MSSDPSSKPQLTVFEAADIARKHYQLEVSAKEWPSYRDQNFLLLENDEPRYVLKFANKDEDLIQLQGRHAALEFLKERMPGQIPQLAKGQTPALSKVR